MIIKSMARKEPSFDQLIQYIEKEDGERLIYHNFYGNDRLKTEEIIKTFKENAKLLPKRKNGNFLYHEILSLENKGNIQGKQLDDIAYELSSLYLEKRAEKQLAFGVLHRDTNNFHIHFCISANELNDPSRVRLSKAQFATIQKDLEYYVLEQYPDLNQSQIYTKPKDKQKIKTSNKEQELKKRTQAPSRKEEIKTHLHGIFEQANTKEELNNLLEESGFRLYTRGRYTGIIDLHKNERRHRLKTLGLLPHYEATQERLEAGKKTIHQPPQHQEVLREEAEVQNLLHSAFEHNKTPKELFLHLQKEGLMLSDDKKGAGVFDLQTEKLYNFADLGLSQVFDLFSQQQETHKKSSPSPENKPLQAVHDLDRQRREQGQEKQQEKTKALENLERQDFQQEQPELEPEIKTQAVYDLEQRDKEPDQPYTPSDTPAPNKATQNLDAMRMGIFEKEKQPEPPEHKKQINEPQPPQPKELPEKPPQKQKVKERSAPEKDKRLDNLDRIIQNNQRNEPKER